LDGIAEVPTFAYGLRKLKKGYLGKAIRVRRSSDNKEEDIGFVGNNLDEYALRSFVGSGHGYVSIWYDQSGNEVDAAQTTINNQPRIVSSGTVVKSNSKPTLDFNIVDATSLVNSVSQAVPYSINMVARFVATSGVMMEGLPSSQRLQYSGGSKLIFYDVSPRDIAEPVGWVSTKLNTYFYEWATGVGNCKMNINAFAQNTTSVASAVTRTGFLIGNKTLLDSRFRGVISEVICFNSTIAGASKTTLLTDQINNFSVT
jgi:hypothetical protein